MYTMLREQALTHVKGAGFDTMLRSRLVHSVKGADFYTMSREQTCTHC